MLRYVSRRLSPLSHSRSVWLANLLYLQMTVSHRSHRHRCSGNFLSYWNDMLQRLLYGAKGSEKRLSSSLCATKPRPVLAPFFLTGTHITKRGPDISYISPTSCQLSAYCKKSEPLLKHHASGDRRRAIHIAWAFS